ncbi:hypothetical protein D1AOALGA4SA_12429 [Olavius algarvensis Delta 1 endosymbiont]|nr:hypothetical protein D1AOALGA4SA_12429 [Olavius algarvensis Delta 1 endosymbiont]
MSSDDCRWVLAGTVLIVIIPNYLTFLILFIFLLIPLTNLDLLRLLL